MKAQKLPVIVEVHQLTRTMTCETLEGTMTGSPGDWLIFGIENEPYFCKDSVFQKTYKLIRDPVQDDSKKGNPVPKKSENQEMSSSDLQIPFSSVTQKKEYNNAWKLCKKHGLPYPEALKKKAEKQPGKKSPSTPPGSNSGKSEIKSDCVVLDAKGNPLFVGAIVKQVLAVGKKCAAGNGVIKAISKDGVCHVAFSFNNKVLTGKHFELIQTGKKPQIVEATKKEGDQDWRKILRSNEPEKVEAT